MYVVQGVAKATSPTLDGLIDDFFKTYWDFMGVDFTIMVNKSLGRV